MSSPHATSTRAASPDATSPQERQRLDKWLWYARVVKTRTLAQKLVRSGGVRVDTARIVRPGFAIRPGMVLTINYAARLRILRVVGAGLGRGPALQAATLYADLSPQPAPRRAAPVLPPNAQREPGSGRPTKKQRRQTDHLRPSQETVWLEFDQKTR